MDPALEAVAILRARGIEVTPCGDDFERWRIGDLIMDDVDLMRLAARMAGPIEAEA